MVKPLKGIVVSNKMMKSVTVMVERIYKHPRWGKYVRGRKKYMGTCLKGSGDIPGITSSITHSSPPFLCFSP
jgi:small subunit ribosomal protein S17|tara:strand:- start:10780 stop:10995 length:216 start_codon:yes stop_codon:yes gene_type:complete